jgi:hypothetical protein
MRSLERFLAWNVWQVWLAPTEFLDRLQHWLLSVGLRGAHDRLVPLSLWILRHLAEPLSKVERRLCSWGEVPGRSLD